MRLTYEELITLMRGNGKHKILFYTITMPVREDYETEEEWSKDYDIWTTQMEKVERILNESN